VIEPKRRDDVPGAPEQAGADDTEDGGLGPFGSWAALYWTVIVYTALAILGLYALTVALDFRVS